MGNMIITISREYGSGGHIIGEQLARELELPFYDKELLTRTMDDSGWNETAFEYMEDHAPSSLLYTLSTGAGLAGAGIFDVTGIPLGDQLFLAQFDAIRSMAAEGSCVICGRCADYILKNEKNCFHVFTHANLDSRIERISQICGISKKDAEAKITRMDKRRATYYYHYTNQKWGMARNYHLTINSGIFGTDHAAALIRAAAERFFVTA